MQKQHSFEITVNGCEEQKVEILVNPKSEAIIALLGGDIGSFTVGTNINGFVIGSDILLWKADICNFDEFIREYEHGSLCDEFQNGFWMEVEDATEIQITLPRHLRNHQVFQSLEAVARLCYI